MVNSCQLDTDYQLRLCTALLLCPGLAQHTEITYINKAEYIRKGSLEIPYQECP